MSTVLELQTDNFEFQIRAYEAGRFMPRHAHEYSKISMVLAGAVTEGSNRTSQLCLPGSVATKPADCDHTDEISPDGLLTCVIKLNPMSELKELWTDSITEYGWVQSQTTTKRMVAIVKALAVRDQKHDLDNRTIEVLSSLHSSSYQKTDAKPPRWLRNRLNDINEAPERSWSIIEIATHANLHPVYVSRAFRKFLGMPLAAYLQRKRVQMGARMLTTANASLAEIAFDSGFADQAHFHRRFKSHFGATPEEYRRLTSY